MVRLITVVLDIALMSMLVSFVVDARERRPFARRRWLLLALVTGCCSLPAMAFDNENLYLFVMLVYVVLCIFQLTAHSRLRTLFVMVCLVIVAGFPLNLVTFLCNVLGIDVIFGYGDALYALAALANVAVIFWVWRVRKRYADGLAIRFSVFEMVTAVFLYLTTMLLGRVMNPAAGELDAAVLATDSGIFLVSAVTGLVVFTNVFFLIMVWRSKTTAYYRQLNALNAQYVEGELAYFAHYKAMQQDVRAFRHDMKHHMARMRQLCAAKDTDALAAYLDEFQSAWTAASEQLFQTGDDGVDALINARTATWRRLGICFTLEGAFARALPLSPFDSCTIFANALDNATEENERLPEGAERWIRFAIKKTAQFHFITIENPLAAPVSADLRTKKADVRNHGFGLVSIRDKAEKNGGSIETRQEDGRFILTIYLPV